MADFFNEDMTRLAMELSEKALAEGDVVAMIQVYESLKGYSL